MAKKNTGWVKISREIVGHWVFDDPNCLKLWIWLICTVNHKDAKVPINSEVLVVHRGQTYTSIREIASTLGMSRNTATKKLKMMQDDGMIFMDSRKKCGTLITVLNYALYQDF